MISVYMVPIRMISAHMVSIRMISAYMVPIRIISAYMVPIRIISAHMVSIRIISAHMVPYKIWEFRRFLPWSFLVENVLFFWIEFWTVSCYWKLRKWKEIWWVDKTVENLVINNGLVMFVIILTNSCKIATFQAESSSDTTPILVSSFSKKCVCSSPK